MTVLERRRVMRRPLARVLPGRDGVTTGRSPKSRPMGNGWFMEVQTTPAMMASGLTAVSVCARRATAWLSGSGPTQPRFMN